MAKFIDPFWLKQTKWHAREAWLYFGWAAKDIFWVWRCLWWAMRPLFVKRHRRGGGGDIDRVV